MRGREDNKESQEKSIYSKQIAQLFGIENVSQFELEKALISTFSKAAGVTLPAELLTERKINFIITDVDKGDNKIITISLTALNVDGMKIEDYYRNTYPSLVVFSDMFLAPEHEMLLTPSSLREGTFDQCIKIKMNANKFMKDVAPFLANSFKTSPKQAPEPSTPKSPDTRPTIMPKLSPAARKSSLMTVADFNKEWAEALGIPASRITSTEIANALLKLAGIDHVQTSASVKFREEYQDVAITLTLLKEQFDKLSKYLDDHFSNAILDRTFSRGVEAEKICTFRIDPKSLSDILAAIKQMPKNMQTVPGQIKVSANTRRQIELTKELKKGLLITLKPKQEYIFKSLLPVFEQVIRKKFNAAGVVVTGLSLKEDLGSDKKPVYSYILSAIFPGDAKPRGFAYSLNDIVTRAVEMSKHPAPYEESYVIAALLESLNTDLLLTAKSIEYNFNRTMYWDISTNCFSITRDGIRHVFGPDQEKSYLLTTPTKNSMAQNSGNEPLSTFYNVNTLRFDDEKFNEFLDKHKFTKFRNLTGVDVVKGTVTSKDILSAMPGKTAENQKTAVTSPPVETPLVKELPSEEAKRIIMEFSSSLFVQKNQEESGTKSDKKEKEKEKGSSARPNKNA